MPSRARLQTALQTVLTEQAESLARTTQVIRRRRKLSGALLLQTLIFGWLTHPAATLTQLTQMAARRGVQLSPQALDQRVTPALVTCLERLLAATLTTLVAVAEPVALPLLQRFSGVWLLDSTSLTSAPTLPNGPAMVPSGSCGPWPETKSRLPCTRTQGKGSCTDGGTLAASGSTNPSSSSFASIRIHASSFDILSGCNLTEHRVSSVSGPV